MTLTCGQILTWNTKGCQATYTAVCSALRSCGLDEEHAKEMKPRTAFSRAAKALEEGRIIRRVSEDKGSIRFQFTQEKSDGQELSYSKETVIDLNKTTGAIDCTNDELKAHLAALLAEKMEERTAGDITKVIQSLFESNADLFPIRDQGGAYFVPERFTDFTVKIDSFLTGLGGKLSRFPIMNGTDAGKRSVKEAVRAKLAGLIDEYNSYIAEFGTDTRDSTIRKQAKKIEAVKFKIDAYKEYLESTADELTAQLTACSKALADKVEEIANTEEQPTEPSDIPFDTPSVPQQMELATA